MKSTGTITLFVVATSLLVINGFFALTATAQQLDKPNLIQSFPVGDGPIGIAFDGANVWTANVWDGTVTKLRASDGTNQGTFPAGPSCWGVVFDGTYVWVTNSNYTSQVTRLLASDGSFQGNFLVGDDPTEILFDGTNIWTSNPGSESVTKLRARDGHLLGVFAIDSPGGLAFDGANIWVKQTSGAITKLRASDGTVLLTAPTGAGGTDGIVFDGASLWLTDYYDNVVVKIRASDGSYQGAAKVGAAPESVAFDGKPYLGN